ncbi:MAG: alkaline phosphatase D family protein [Bryobacter sp.]
MEAQTAPTGPFAHGVASGDPLVDRVIIWTRVTPNSPDENFPVEWQIAADPGMRNVLQNGVTSTNSSFDFTVKVDVKRLDPGGTYYYQFSYRGALSPIGRTRTLPAGDIQRARMAVVSCSNHPFGFFNAYRIIANREDLDAVVHLGDYIYEYAEGTYGTGAPLGRIPVPNKEIVTLTDYRQRFGQYRLDPDLQEAHRQHPWICVWDDHESTNDSWFGGAENHQPETEGDWSQRRAVAALAWFEWMPVRENPFQNLGIYRNFRYGNLLDLTMLDTRLEARDQQVAANSPLIADPSRTLLGATQEEWLYRQLANSQGRGARWRVIGQQVMMGNLVGPDGILNPDQWDGYLGSRTRFLGFLAQQRINNVVVLTGDIHSSWANEIAVNPFAPGTAAATRQAVEFVTTAVTSPGIEDPAQAVGLAQQLRATHPHIQYVDLQRRGYLLLDVDADRAQGQWYHLATIRERSTQESLAATYFAANGEARLQAGR